MQREHQFNSKFEALVTFKNQHGHVNAHPDMGKALSSWVYRLRRQYQDRTLDIEKRKKLNAIGFQWENPRLVNSKKKKAFVVVEPSPPSLSTRLHQREEDVAIAADMLLQLSRLEAHNDEVNHHGNGHNHYNKAYTATSYSHRDARRSIREPSFDLNDYMGFSSADVDADERDFVDKDDDDKDWSPVTEKENRITPHTSTKRAPTITPASTTHNINDLLSNYKGITSLPDSVVFGFCFACRDDGPTTATSCNENTEHHKMCPKHNRCNLMTLDKKIRGAKVGCEVCSHQLETGTEGRHAKHSTNCPRSKSYTSPATKSKKRKSMSQVPLGEATNRVLFSPSTKIPITKTFKTLKHSTASTFSKQLRDTFPSLHESYVTYNNHHQYAMAHMHRRF